MRVRARAGFEKRKKKNFSLTDLRESVLVSVQNCILSGQKLNLITFPFLLSLKLWRPDWNVFRGIFYGVLQLSVSNIHWWLGKRFAYLASWVVWEFGIWRILIRPY